ncbi:hypothetical protein TNCV_3956491 [Trichonephila clavipes]|nr:hypothetical protein TNCV_3956491 [Trichonephila clavipes]
MIAAIYTIKIRRFSCDSFNQWFNTKDSKDLGVHCEPLWFPLSDIGILNSTEPIPPWWTSKWSIRMLKRSVYCIANPADCRWFGNRTQFCWLNPKYCSPEMSDEEMVLAVMCRQLKALYVVVANVTCLTVSDRIPQNSSWQRISRTPVVSRSFEHHESDNTIWLGSTQILGKNLGEGSNLQAALNS